MASPMPGMMETELTDVTGGSFCWWCSDAQCGCANRSHDYVENYSLSNTCHSFGILCQSNKYGCNISSNDAYCTVYIQDYLDIWQLLYYLVNRLRLLNKSLYTHTCHYRLWIAHLICDGAQIRNVITVTQLGWSSHKLCRYEAYSDSKYHFAVKKKFE